MLRDSPYQGLRPFAEEDAAFFFGRETETRIISANLRTRRLTLLYGPSGVGKSSVLQAGVIYNLNQLNTQLQLEHVAFPDDDFEKEGRIEDNAYTSTEAGHTTSEFSKSIVVVTFEKWIDDPHPSLKDAILTSLNESLPSIFTPEKNDELHQLGLRDMLENVAGHSQVMELLIILDQFEQYFVRHRAEEKPGNFAAEFCRAVSSRKLRANFLVSIREDWLASLDLFTGRVPSVFDNSIRLAHMDLASAKTAIWNPILKYNELIRRQEGQPGFNRKQVRIEEDFVTEALNQLEQLDLNGNDPENSESSSELKSARPLIQESGLQIVLQRLWNEVKNDDPPTLSEKLLPPGAAKRIFQSHVNDSLKPLSFRDKIIAEKLFPLLSTSSGAKLADSADSLAERSRCKPEAVKALVKKLTETKILNEHGPLNVQAPLLYEITSDVLAAPIRNWVRE